MATLIRNVTAGPLTLPMPYNTILSQGQGVVVQDSIAAAIANLGGVQALSSILEVRDVGSGGGGLQAFDPTPRKSLTANKVLLVGDNGRTFDNFGATGTVVATLPASGTLPLNWKTHYRVAAAFPLQALAQGADIFRYDGTPAASQFWQSANVDTCFTVEYQGNGLFLIVSHEGELVDA